MDEGKPGTKPASAASNGAARIALKIMFIHFFKRVNMLSFCEFNINIIVVVVLLLILILILILIVCYFSHPTNVYVLSRVQSLIR